MAGSPQLCVKCTGEGRGGEGSVFDPSIQLDLLSFLG